MDDGWGDGDERQRLTTKAFVQGFLAGVVVVSFCWYCSTMGA